MKTIVHLLEVAFLLYVIFGLDIAVSIYLLERESGVGREEALLVALVGFITWPKVFQK